MIVSLPTGPVACYDAPVFGRSSGRAPAVPATVPQRFLNGGGGGAKEGGRRELSQLTTQG